MLSPISVGVRVGSHRFVLSKSEMFLLICSVEFVARFTVATRRFCLQQC